MNICMVGAGYVGLVSAVCFSEFGWSVTCIDPSLASRTTLIELILELNPTTTRDWLNSFGDTELLAYYDHVSLTQLPRNGKNPWVRCGDVAGVARFSEAS